MKFLIRTISLLFALGLSTPIGTFGNPARTQADAPKGIVLNLDFQNIREGLIPNKTLYPLYVPLGGLGTKTIDERTHLMLNKKEGLTIPHSSLLDPDGSTWVTSIRVVARTDGIIMSQGNDTSGYVIYLKEGVVHATIRTASSQVTLRESKASGIGNVIKKQVSIVLTIQSGSASLILNRRWVASAPINQPLAGENHRIRIGEHAQRPIALQQNPRPTPSGFTGGISAFKILRQKEIKPPIS